MTLRFSNRTGQHVVDLAVLAFAYLAGYLLRFEGHVPAEMLRTLAWTLPYVVALQYGLMLAFSVHRMAWRYIGLPEVRRIGIVVALGVLALVAVRLLIPGLLLTGAPWAVRAVIPIGIILSFGFLSFLGVVGVRVLRRTLSERQEVHHRPRSDRGAVPTMLIGAGRAGVLVAKEIAARPDIGIVVVGFLDDDPAKMGTVMHGIPVIGTTEDVGRHCAKYGAKQALITMASASGKEIRHIVEMCELHQIPVKIVPGLFEIVGGRVNLSRIRPVAIEDLLRREPVKLDEDAILGVVRGRSVLVSGAGGSIGSELCRQICSFAPEHLVLVEHGENNLFQIERELRDRFPEVKLHAYVGDVRDASRMAGIFTDRRPHVVFHAAAHKHVPMMEANPGEAIKNNVLGTKLLAEIADEYGVSEFVMISTDKAVNPSSVMGASKRAAEIVIQAMSQRSKTRFVAVRFGNVLGSTGSVVPIFQEQIARGGPVTVTHPEMTRYFMTIPEACQLVLEAAAMGKGGEIFVLDMGKPVKVLDLARDVIALSGLREGEDIEIHFTGIRPGEKLYEELSLEEEGVERTGHPKVFIGRIRPHPWGHVVDRVTELASLAEDGDGDRIRTALRQLVPEYSGHAGSAAPRRAVAVAPSRSEQHLEIAAAAPNRSSS
ncbi:MAG TPA: nucleoside-diphosphate sugar epimerase/dehydratase [Polyangiaceae bacterium]|jgi:FlaA1/EpsC-like NDP-sugar epimerase